MRLNNQINNAKVICINLKCRKEKKKYMKIQCNRRNIPVEFYIAEKNENPKRGCLESHLSVIESAIKNNTECTGFSEKKTKKPLKIKNIVKNKCKDCIFFKKCIGIM